MDIEEFKRSLKEDRKEIERLMAEADRAAKARELADTSLAEMRAYMDRVRKGEEERKQYWNLPWWKRLFTKYPEFIA